MARKGKRTWQARVSTDIGETLLTIAKAEGHLSEGELVKRGLDLVVMEADRDREILARRLHARFEAQSKALAGIDVTADSDDDAADHDNDPLPELEQVPPGDKTFQTSRLNSMMSERLSAIARAYELNESQIVRRGLYLVIEDAADRLPELRKNLQRDHQADKRALRRVAEMAGGPARRTPPPLEHTSAVEAAPSPVTPPPATPRPTAPSPQPAPVTTRATPQPAPVTTSASPAGSESPSAAPPSSQPTSATASASPTSSSEAGV